MVSSSLLRWATNYGRTVQWGVDLPSYLAACYSSGTGIALPIGCSALIVHQSEGGMLMICFV